MSKLRDLLLNQKSEISAKVVPLVAEVARMKEALATKQSLLEGLRLELEQIHSALKAVESAEAKNRQITIMEAVLNVLNENPQGMTALEILAEINTRYFGGSLRRTSLSPQLSRLKDRDKKIELRGNVWFRLPDEPSLFSPKS
jgi:hypothetical protein